jgi:hypothetical protein
LQDYDTVKFHNFRLVVKCEKRQIEPLKIKGTPCRKVRKLTFLGVYYKVRLYGIYCIKIENIELNMQSNTGSLFFVLRKNEKLRAKDMGLMFKYKYLYIQYAHRLFHMLFHSVPYQTILYRYAKKKLVLPKITRFAKSTVR